MFEYRDKVSFANATIGFHYCSSTCAPECHSNRLRLGLCAYCAIAVRITAAVDCGRLWARLLSVLVQARLCSLLPQSAVRRASASGTHTSCRAPGELVLAPADLHQVHCSARWNIALPVTCAVTAAPATAPATQRLEKIATSELWVGHGSGAAR